MSSEFQPPNIAPQDDGSGTAVVAEAPEPTPITEQEVGEYREQDRFLPVRLRLCPPFHILMLKIRCYIHIHNLTSIHTVFSLTTTTTMTNKRIVSKNFDTRLSSVDRKRLANHEVVRPRHSQDIQRGKRMRAGVRVRVHQLHHFRSGGEVSDGEAENDRRGGYLVRDGHARV